MDKKHWDSIACYKSNTQLFSSCVFLHPETWISRPLLFGYIAVDCLHQIVFQCYTVPCAHLSINKMDKLLSINGYHLLGIKPLNLTCYPAKLLWNKSNVNPRRVCMLFSRLTQWFHCGCRTVCAYHVLSTKHWKFKLKNRVVEFKPKRSVQEI